MKNLHEPAGDPVPAPQARTPVAPGIGRCEFWLFSFIVIALSSGLATLAGKTGSDERGVGGILVFVFLFVLLTGLQTVLCAARLRNTGSHPGWAFLSLVPLFCIVLLPRLLFFRPKYVEKPRFGAFGWSVASFFVLLIVSGAVWLFSVESRHIRHTRETPYTRISAPSAQTETIAGLRIRKGSLKWERGENTYPPDSDVRWKETWKAEDHESGIIYHITRTEHAGKAGGYFYRRETFDPGDLFFDKIRIAGIPSEGIYMEAEYTGRIVHCVQSLFAKDKTGWEIGIMAPGKEEALDAFTAIASHIISVAE